MPARVRLPASPHRRDYCRLLVGAGVADLRMQRNIMGAAGAMVFPTSHPARAKSPAVFQALRPTGRLSRQEDVAYGALHLTSDGSTFFTKVALVIDAGRTAR